MKKLAVLALLVLPLATGCKSKSEKACQHMIDLATEELDKEIEKIEKLGELDKDGSMKKMAQGLREKAKAKTASDLETCATKMEEHDIDASCILDADSIAEAQRCLKKR